MFPERYPSYMGNLMGFDPTALPKAHNPIIAATGKKGHELLYEDFIDSVKVEHYRPASDGYIYREFHTKQNKIIAFSEIEPGSAPTWNDIKPHWTLGYPGIRKVSPENSEMKLLLKKKYGISDSETNPGNQKNSYFYNFYRFLNAEEQGLSTNLRKDSAQFMNGCKMHRLSLKHFLQRFPFGEDSELIADWDYGHNASVAPAGARGTWASSSTRCG